MNGNETYKPMQRIMLSQMQRQALCDCKAIGVQHPVSHETALAIWGIEQPSGSGYRRSRTARTDHAEIAGGPAYGYPESPSSDYGYAEDYASTEKWNDSTNTVSDNSLIHVVLNNRNDRRARKHVRMHVWKGLNGKHVLMIDGVRVLAPAPTWALMAGPLDVGELTILAESMIRHRRLTLNELRKFVSTAQIPYRSKCMDALSLVRQGSDSPKETEMRLVLERYGLPPMKVNYTVSDVLFGNGAMTTLDLADPSRKLGLEYDGDHHRTDRRQWRRDQNKRMRLTSAGWVVLVITQLDLSDELHRAAFAMNVAHALSNIDGRPIVVNTPIPWSELARRRRKMVRPRRRAKRR
nr:hypothetical protein [Bifidobacterium dentium]